MKHQNRIAQRIIASAKSAWFREGIFVYTSGRFKLNDSEADELMRRVGAKIQGIELEATVYMSPEGDIESISLNVTTLSPPYLRKNLNFYNHDDLEHFGDQIAWVVNEVLKGNGKELRTPEEEYEYIQEEEKKRQYAEYDSYEYQDWQDETI